ncbi:ammonium transporter [Reyranella sp. CPCC 100927]|uniref:ammonium transporter n=1 Tax=Reyranella sp. CPCC 100927 TaxID=2599616 RepID=UPI0011B44DBB|nr:ammonium transporter [Reyranella sp. CPCC 100927]TWT02571.1 ammonium transporter [Reyranella sp. CPCC 100927]
MPAVLSCVRRLGLPLPVGLAVVLLPAIAIAADDKPKIDSGDTAWMIVATSLVLLMSIPGLALFYAGMVRKKNVLATTAQTLATVALVTVLWVVVGYSLVFTPGNSVIGDLSRFMMAGLKMDSVHDAAKTVPENIFMMFQLTFAAITPAIVVGSAADRIKFSAMLWFMALWLILVYCPVAHWVWGGGFLQKAGVLDFAGGIVVHINAGVAGLVLALMLGPRRGYPTENMAPHNLVLTVIGVSLLWVGWFGFNAGSAVAADARAGMALTVTHVSAATAALAWMFAEWATMGKPSVLGIASGAVAGLGTITPASGYVDISAALVIGLVAGLGCFYASTAFKRRMGYDDSLDVFGVHGVGGLIGTVMVGIFATSAIAGPDVKGLIDGNSQQVLTQLYGIICTVALSAIGTAVILKAIDATIGLRVTPEQEIEGLDINLHGESVH